MEKLYEALRGWANSGADVSHLIMGMFFIVIVFIISLTVRIINDKTKHDRSYAKDNIVVSIFISFGSFIAVMLVFSTMVNIEEVKMEDRLDTAVGEEDVYIKDFGELRGEGVQDNKIVIGEEENVIEEVNEVIGGCRKDVYMKLSDGKVIVCE